MSGTSWRTCADADCAVEYMGTSGYEPYHGKRCRDRNTRGRLRSRERRPQRLGRKREAAASRRLGGRLQPGSGNNPCVPGDFKVESHLVEHKSTSAKSYRITLEAWKKIKSEAALVGKSPMLMLNIDGVRLCVTEEPV